MVETLTKKPPLNLQDLEKILQKRLYSEPLQLVPLQLRCVLRENILSILVQHPEPVLPYPRLIFRLLREVLEDEQITRHYEVLMYLRLHGQKRPYSFYSLKIESESTPELFHSSQAFISNLSSDQKSEQEELSVNLELNNQENQRELDHNCDDLSAQKKQFFMNKEESDIEIPLNLELNESENPEEENLFPNFVEKGDIPVQDDLQDLLEDEPQYYSEDNDYTPRTRRWGKGLTLALISSLTVFAGTFYFLTRPCVIGQCAVLTEAEQGANASLSILRQNPTGGQIFEAQKQLGEAIALLEKIPRWSANHSKAELLLTRYQEKAQTLDNLIDALKIASQASQKTQKPPYGVDKWQEVQQDWRTAIARLETIKSDSELYLLAQTKISEYRNNLNTINGRLNEEAQAVEKLNIAQETIKVAQVRQGTAQSLDNWQLVDATWQTALNRLKEIPPSTTVYHQAQKLINDSASLMAEVRDKKNQELFAVNAYNQALRLAQLAKNAEMSKQWSTAVYQWRNALNYAQQVPQSSFQYNQVPPLLNAYQGALSQAENQLRKAMKLQQAQADLSQTCQGITKICEFTLTDSTIKVNLTPQYVQDIRNTALAAKAQENNNTQIALLDHIATVEKSLQTISNNTGLTVEVYEPNQALAVVYKPKFQS